MKLKNIDETGMIFGVDSSRKFRETLITVAYQIVDQKQKKILLVFHEPALTDERLKKEWAYAERTFRKEILEQIRVVVHRFNRYEFLGKPDPAIIKQLEKVTSEKRERTGMRLPEGGASFKLMKVLLNRFLMKNEPMTTKWLSDAAGCSYPTTALLLRRLGSAIERRSDRRIRLHWFPKEEFARLLVMADQSRSTIRYADPTGQAQSPESYIRRLEKTNPPHLAIGGVPAVLHYHPALDIVSAPRLDLSLHNPANYVTLDFIEKLDPALQPVKDPLLPANVVVHIVRHAASLFEPRRGGLFWVDPLECLLDLHENRLEAQAAEFLNALLDRWKSDK